MIRSAIECLPVVWLLECSRVTNEETTWKVATEETTQNMVSNEETTQIILPGRKPLWSFYHRGNHSKYGYQQGNYSDHFTTISNFWTSVIDQFARFIPLKIKLYMTLLHWHHLVHGIINQYSAFLKKKLKLHTKILTSSLSAPCRFYNTLLRANHF